MRDLDIRGAGNLLGAEQSGFISEIGYEMYNKILDEAMFELREEQSKDDLELEPDHVYVKDCQIETDLEILIPNDYVTAGTERLSLYKELDNIESETELQKFETRLIDRFGALPEPALELMQTIRLRWLARKIGFEKLLLKNERLIGYFTGGEDSNYFQSDAFTAVLNFIKNNPRACKMRESKDKLSIVFERVTNVDRAIKSLQPMEASKT
jgi:transcription-repair coupling factor (superfamily II helicase)